MLFLSCVLAVTSVLTGYVCEVFVESICNVIRLCDFLFTIRDGAWHSYYIPWTHFTHVIRSVLVLGCCCCYNVCGAGPWVVDVRSLNRLFFVFAHLLDSRFIKLKTLSTCPDKNISVLSCKDHKVYRR